MDSLKQLEEYRKKHQERHRRDDEARKKQEKEDEELARKLSQDLENERIVQRNYLKKSLDEDEQLARILQEEEENISTFENEITSFDIGSNLEAEENRIKNDGVDAEIMNNVIRQDEELARRLQEEEEEQNFQPYHNFMFRSPSPISRPEVPSLFHNGEDFNRFEQMRSLRELNATMNALSPQEHPLINHMRNIMAMNRGHNRAQPRQIIFPDPFFHIEGMSSLPPHLVQMMRGDQPADYESLLELGELLQPVNRGASKEQLDTIPSCKFKKGTMKEEEGKCGICLQEYEEEEELTMLPRCLHHFHKQCSDKWLSINKICPVCRADIDSNN